MTDTFRALVLGVIQGLTEFIPVSSSAHLVLLPWAMGWPGSGLAFNLALQIGTLVAVLIYFWDDLVRIFGGALIAIATRGRRKREEFYLAMLLALGSVPAAVIGFVFKEPIDSLFHSGQRSVASIAIVATGLGVMGLLLVVADRRNSETAGSRKVGIVTALVIGFAQSLALVPGVSRSGSTISAGLFLGLDRREAARFSFLLSVPITFGAGMLEGVDLLETGLSSAEYLPFAVGMLSAAAVGYASIWFLLRFLQTHSYGVFAIYRIVLAVLVFGLILTGFKL